MVYQYELQGTSKSLGSTDLLLQPTIQIKVIEKNRTAARKHSTWVEFMPFLNQTQFWYTTTTCRGIAYPIERQREVWWFSGLIEQLEEVLAKKQSTELVAGSPTASTNFPTPTSTAYLGLSNRPIKLFCAALRRVKKKEWTLNKRRYP